MDLDFLEKMCSAALSFLNSVEIFCFIKFGKNLIYVTKIGLVAILAPIFFEEELMHPIFVVREFMIQFYTPTIRNVIP